MGVEGADELDAHLPLELHDGWRRGHDESVCQLLEVFLEEVVVLFEVGVSERLLDAFEVEKWVHDGYFRYSC